MPATKRTRAAAPVSVRPLVEPDLDRADEIFRVFATEHPKVLLRWTGSVPDVEAMIKRARAAGHVMDSNQLALFGSSLRSSPKTTARMHLTDYQSEGDQSKGS